MNMSVGESESNGRIYYRGRELTVTSDSLILQWPGTMPGHLRLSDVRTLNVTHLATGRRRTLLVGLISLLVTAGGLIAYQRFGWWLAIVVVGGAGSMVVHCVTSLVRSRNNPQWTVSCGVWNGELILCTSDDAEEVGRLVKAVRSAIRDNRTTR